MELNDRYEENSEGEGQEQRPPDPVLEGHNPVGFSVLPDRKRFPHEKRPVPVLEDWVCKKPTRIKGGEMLTWRPRWKR